jgi:hypothetical protein
MGGEPLMAASARVRLAVTTRRSGAWAAWRWRSELLIAAALTVVYFRLSWWLGSYSWSVAVLGGVALVLAVTPGPRRFLLARFWCLLSRHRLQQAWWQMRLHNRHGHLPLVLWIRPTGVGERAWVLCPAGLCADDFIKATPEMAAACAAREVRVTASRRLAPLVTIDVLRRDLLSPGKIVASPLTGTGLVPAAVLDQLVSVPEPPPAAPVWPDVDPGGDWS